MHDRLISLCVFSEAVGGRYETADCKRLKVCPLGLSSAEGKKCPCRSSEDVGSSGGDGYMKPVREQHVTVLACTFPEMYTGEVIRNAVAFVAAWRRRRQQ
jgi:hypothetical protein